jgi:dTDP-4-dehydrorhamnose reductase
MVEATHHRHHAPPNTMETKWLQMKLLITGASGLLGSKLTELAITRSHQVYSVDIQLPTHGIPVQLDISDKNKVEKTLKRIKPDAVIHTAALTDVDKCETEKALAYKINAEATDHIAAATARIGAHLTYVSTDYVFDGEQGFYKEEDETNPISYYGYTKLKGEEFTKEHAGKWCITRISVLYGWSGNKQNFATWLINSLRQKREVKVLEDQYVSPTLNTNLAEMLLEISQKKVLGTLHTAGATRVSRYEYALKLAEVFSLDTGTMKPARTEEMQWKAKRPRDSSLNVTKAKACLLNKPMALDEALEAMAKENHLHSQSEYNTGYR